MHRGPVGPDAYVSSDRVAMSFGSGWDGSPVLLRWGEPSGPALHGQGGAVPWWNMGPIPLPGRATETRRGLLLRGVADHRTDDAEGDPNDSSHDEPVIDPLPRGDTLRFSQRRGKHGYHSKDNPDTNPNQ